MEPVQQPSESNTTRRYVKPVTQTEDTRFNEAMTSETSRIMPPSGPREVEKSTSLDTYRQELRRLFDDAFVDQALIKTRLFILMSADEVKRMYTEPQFERSVLNALYNGIHAAVCVAPLASLLLKVKSDGTVESFSGGDATTAELEEAAIHAFWMRQPVDGNLSSADSWRTSYKRSPRPRRKLNRRRVRIWLEKRRRQFFATQKALYNILANIGDRFRISSEKEEKNAGDDQDE